MTVPMPGLEHIDKVLERARLTLSVTEWLYIRTAPDGALEVCVDDGSPDPLVICICDATGRFVASPKFWREPDRVQIALNYLWQHGTQALQLRH